MWVSIAVAAITEHLVQKTNTFIDFNIFLGFPYYLWRVISQGYNSSERQAAKPDEWESTESGIPSDLFEVIIWFTTHRKVLEVRTQSTVVSLWLWMLSSGLIQWFHISAEWSQAKCTRRGTKLHAGCYLQSERQVQTTPEGSRRGQLFGLHSGDGYHVCSLIWIGTVRSSELTYPWKVTWLSKFIAMNTDWLKKKTVRLWTELAVWDDWKRSWGVWSSLYWIVRISRNWEWWRRGTECSRQIWRGARPTMWSSMRKSDMSKITPTSGPFREDPKRCLVLSMIMGSQFSLERLNRVVPFGFVDL